MDNNDEILNSLVKEWEDEIPYQFHERPNLHILINAFGRQLTDLQKVFYDLKYNTDLDNAVGKNLDNVGDIVGISRMDAYYLLDLTRYDMMTDGLYRNVLRFECLRKNSDATYADLMKGLHLLWGPDAKISYHENPPTEWYNGKPWNKKPDPATIRIDLDDVPNDEFPPFMIVPMVIKAAGVKIMFRLYRHGNLTLYAGCCWGVHYYRAGITDERFNVSRDAEGTIYTGVKESHYRRGALEERYNGGRDSEQDTYIGLNSKRLTYNAPVNEAESSELQGVQSHYRFNGRRGYRVRRGAVATL